MIDAWTGNATTPPAANMVHRGERVEKGFIPIPVQETCKRVKNKRICLKSFEQIHIRMSEWNIREIYVYEINCWRSINLSGSFIGVYMREQWICNKVLATLQMCWHEKHKPGSVGADACKKRNSGIAVVILRLVRSQQQREEWRLDCSGLRFS